MEKDDAFKLLGQFPHCDQTVLHKKGACEYCDALPEWQALRVAWGINFSGESDPAKIPCPSTRTRTAEQVNRWGGNVAKPGEPQPERITAWEQLDRIDIG